MKGFTLPITDTIIINGKLYSKKALCIAWFKLSNDMFFDIYGFNFNPHEYEGLYEWGQNTLYGDKSIFWRGNKNESIL